MAIRYEVRRTSPTSTHVLKCPRSGAEVLRDFATKGCANGALVTAVAMPRIIDLLGRITDRMGLNLLDLIHETELTEHYYAVVVREGQKGD